MRFLAAHRCLTVVLLTLATAFAAPACGGGGSGACPPLRYRETAASGPIPDLTDITHDRGVAQAVSGVTEHPFDVEELCITRPHALPGVISVSARDVDYGCLSLGYLFHREYVADVRVAAPVMAALGWAEATLERKGRLARAWVEQVAMRETRFLDSAPSGLEGEFQAPRIEQGADGGVIVEGWVQRPSRSGTGGFQLRRFTFDAEGNLSATEAVRCVGSGD